MSKSSTNNTPKLSIPKGTLINKIEESIKKTCLQFAPHLRNHWSSKKLNENELTQEFTALLRRNVHDYPFEIGGEDFHDKGRPDFYFYSAEDGESTESIFTVEAKRLPAPPPKEREQEYVEFTITDLKANSVKQKGGMERFKHNIHGSKLNHCGMLGFIEENEFTFWLKTINDWINDLVKTNPSNWASSEKLKKKESKSDHYISTSNVNRINSSQLILSHFWVKI